MDMKQQIREHMPVFCSAGDQIGVVDHLDGDNIKLTKEGSQDGQHHWIPLSWVTRVDEHVHLDRDGGRVMKEWSSAPPTGTMVESGEGSSASM